MANYKLTIRVGGLGLFVRRWSLDAGVVILMPRAHMHRAQIIKDKATVGYLSGNFIWDWLGGGLWRPWIKNAAHFTALTKGRVPSTLCDPAQTPKDVEARFWLPWPKRAEIIGDVVGMKLSKGNQDEVFVGGIVELEYTFDRNLVIPMTPVRPGLPNYTVVAGQDHELVIGNVTDPNPPAASYPYPPGHHVKHARHYFDLMKGWGVGEPPEVWTTRPYDYHPEKMRLSYVNPVECIIGTACEEGALFCGND